VVQRHNELPTLYFSCSVSFNFSLIIIQKQQKHANNQNHKNIFFTINLDPQIKWFPFLFSFLIKFQINFNSTLSFFFFNIKNTNQFHFVSWLFTFKPFSKTNKKIQNKSNKFFTPNYEVLINHGYVGKWRLSFRINKKCR